jgi:hypothetical protein
MGEKKGLIDSKNRILLPFDYDHIKPLSPALFGIELQKQKGVWHVQKGWIHPLKSDIHLDFYGNHLHIYERNRVGYTDLDGKTLIPTLYEELCTKGGVIYAKRNGKRGVLDKQENILIPFLYDDIRHFDNKHIIAIKNEKYGLLSKNNTVVIPCTFDMMEAISNFSESEKYIIVKKDKKYGLMNRKGRLLLKIEYDHINRNIDGKNRIEVEKNGHEYPIPLSLCQLPASISFLFE